MNQEDGDRKTGKREPRGETRVVSGWCSSDCKGAYVVVYSVWPKEYSGLVITFLFTAEGLTAGLWRWFVWEVLAARA